MGQRDSKDDYSLKKLQNELDCEGEITRMIKDESALNFKLKE